MTPSWWRAVLLTQLWLTPADVRHEAIEFFAEARAFARQAARRILSTSSAAARVDLHDVGGGFLRALRDVLAAACGSPSSAAVAMVEAMSEILPMVPPISSIAATDSVSRPDARDVIRDFVGRFRGLAGERLDLDGTTAKWRPASPRAASMVAFSASKLVCSAVISLTTSCGTPSSLPMRPSVCSAWRTAASAIWPLSLTRTAETTQSLSSQVAGASIGGVRDRGTVGLRRRDRPPRQGKQPDCGGRRPPGRADRRPHRQAVACRAGDRRRRQADHGDCRADQSAGAERHHRGGPRRRRRPRLCGGRLRGQVARQPDREGDRRNLQSHLGHAGRDTGNRSRRSRRSAAPSARSPTSPRRLRARSSSRARRPRKSRAASRTSRKAPRKPPPTSCRSIAARPKPARLRKRC